MDALSSTSSPTSPDRSEPLLRSTIVIYGSIGLPLAVVGYPIAIWLIPHYSGALGVSLAAVSTMLMLARITDVVTDPLIGEASDRSRTRFGRRKPWLLAGTPIMMLGIYRLFVPEAGFNLSTREPAELFAEEVMPRFRDPAATRGAAE